MADKKKYYIHVPEATVEVSQDLYKEYYRAERSMLTQEEKDKRNGVVHFDDINAGPFSAEEVITDRDAIPVEDHVIEKLMADKVRHCLGLLSNSERELIFAIYYEGHSQRELSKISGVPLMTIHDRVHKILVKLNKLLKK